MLPRGTLISPKLLQIKLPFQEQAVQKCIWEVDSYDAQGEIARATQEQNSLQDGGRRQSK